MLRLFLRNLCFLFIIIPICENYEVSYNDYANHYNFLFNNYKISANIPTIKTIIFVEKIFDVELTEEVGSINIFMYSCFYWIDNNLPTWNNQTQYNLKYFTFVYNKKKCPLNYPLIASSSENSHVTIKQNGLVFTCPASSRKVRCYHNEFSRYPNDIYNCHTLISVYSNVSWPVECGSYANAFRNFNTTSKENCRMLNSYYNTELIHYLKVPNNNWILSNLSITANMRYTYLSISLKRIKGSQYFVDVMISVTLGFISSSTLLIPLQNKIRILTSIFLIFASNIWIRFGLAEQAFAQYGLNENLIKYYQVVLIVQLISLVISCINCLMVSKLYAQYQPPLILIRFCSFCSIIGRIDPIFKKGIYFLDGIPLNINTTDCVSEQNSAIFNASKIGWKEITLILDRVIFVLFTLIIIIFGIVYL